jgi:NAD+ diphosphatase
MAPSFLSHPGLQQQSLEALGFWIPPPVAVAHHLIKAWALREGPWFGQPQPAKHSTPHESGVGVPLEAEMPTVAQQEERGEEPRDMAKL